MAIFSDKVVTAKFIDSPNNMNIEVLYKEGEKTIPYNIAVDFSNDIFNELLEDITLEEIEAQTKAIMSANAELFNKMVRAEMAKRWAEEEKKIKQAYDDVDAYALKQQKKQFEAFEEYEAEQKRKQAKEVDQYAEDQKSIKFDEVRKEMKAYRDELQSKFNASDIPHFGVAREVSASELISILHEKNNDNDFVFNTKIAILEDPDITKTKDKSLKLAIRKAKTLQELIGTYTSSKV